MSETKRCSVEGWCGKDRDHDGACVTTQVLLAREAADEQAVSESRHTPTPWEFTGNEINVPYSIDPKMPVIVGQESGDSYESYGRLILSHADGEFIVRAVNAHDALVDFVRKVAGDRDDCVSPGFKELARAALKAAGVGSD